jgi:hypothetical protein
MKDTRVDFQQTVLNVPKMFGQISKRGPSIRQTATVTQADASGIDDREDGVSATQSVADMHTIWVRTSM